MKRVQVGSRRWVKLRKTIFERDGYFCQNCGTVGGTANPLSLDHIVPRHAGGDENPANLQILCRSCNSRKHTGALAPPATRLPSTTTKISSPFNRREEQT